MTTRHEDLAAWRHSIALAAKVYAATRHLPSDEPLGLVRELRRAALSVPSSIAEGAALGRYRKALTQNLSPEIHAMVRRQLERAQRNCDLITWMRDRLRTQAQATNAD